MYAGVPNIEGPTSWIDRSTEWTGYHTEQISIKDGLPQTEILDLLLTDNDFLWVATVSGLVRYDGRTLDLYTEHAPNAKQDRSCRFFYTINGVDYIVFRDFSSSEICANGYSTSPVSRYLNSQYSVRFKGNYVHKDFYEAYSYNTVWSLTDSMFLRVDSDGFYQLNNAGKKHSYALRATDSTNKRLFVLQDRAFLLTRQGYFLEFKSNTIDTIDYYPELKLPPDFNIIWRAMKDEAFLHYNNQLFSISLEDKNLKLELLLSELPDNIITSVIRHPTKNTIFIGTTTKGLLQINKHSVSQVNIKDYCEGFHSTYALAKVGKDSVLSSAGILFSDGKAFCKTRLTPEIPLNSLYFDSISSTLYSSIEDSLSFPVQQDAVDPKIPYIDRHIRLPGSTITTHQNTIYFIINEMGLFKLNGLNPELLLSFNLGESEYPNYLLGSNQEFFWLGTTNGLYRIHLANQTIDTIPDLADLPVRFIKEHEGYTWVTTYGSGIFLIKGNRCVRLNLQDLPALQTSHAIYIKDDLVFISTNNGLFLLSLENILSHAGSMEPFNLFYKFSEIDGLYFTEFNGGCQPSVVQSSAGSIAFPTLKGIVTLRPQSLSTPMTNDQIYIEAVHVNNQRISSASEYALEPDFNAVKFSLLNPYYGQSNNFSIYYRIREISRKWAKVEQNRSLTINRLPPGRYTLELGLGSPFTKFISTKKQITLQVDAPFYQSSLFIIGCYLFAIAILFSIALSVIRRRQKEKEILELKINTKTIELEQTNKILNDILNKMNALQQKLVDNYQIKNKVLEFFTTDIRTPLSHFYRKAKEIQEKAYKHKYEKIYNQVSFLVNTAGASHKTAENVLLWITSQTNQLSKNRIDVVAVVNQIISEHQKEAQFKNVHLNKIEVEEEGTMWFEVGALEVIFSNIYSNALKFANSFIHTNYEQNEEKISITVTNDSGKISQQLLLNLNEGNTVKSALGNSGEVGSGIGLVIVRELVLRNQGSIEFMTVNQSSFVVRIDFSLKQKKPTL